MTENQNTYYTLLLTACIHPQNSANVNRCDPLVRLKDYETALKYWLSIENANIRNIVFVENSGYNLSSLKSISEADNLYNRRVEFLQYKEVSVDKSVHYGYYEYKMLDFCFENSKLITKDSFIIKATGRLIFEKISRLIDYHSRRGFNFFCDSRDYSLFGKFTNHSILTTLFFSSPDFYNKVLKGKCDMMLEESYYYMENLYFELIKPHFKDDSVKIRFPFNVDPIGYGGHNNSNYNSVSFKLKSFVRGLMRRLFPNFYI